MKMLEYNLLINIIFCYQLFLPENHFLPKDAVSKYQEIVNFTTILGKL